MRESSELRKKAALARRAASIRTDGGHEADLYLVALASQLEEQADKIERQKPKAQSDREPVS